MLILINILIIIVYIFLLGLAIFMLINGGICDNHTCHSFVQACLKKTKKEQIKHLLDNLCEESLWPYAYIASSIIMLLLIVILPLPYKICHFIIIFLISFISLYCIIGFLVYHYVRPIKKYILEYIDKHCK